MARIRTVKPDLWRSPKMARVSRDARLLFIALLTEADDEGLLLASPKLLAGALYPHDADVTARKVEKWLAELATEGMVLLYRVDDATYAHIIGFLEHQRISHPTESVLPNPTGEGAEILTNNSGAALAGKEGKGKEWKGGGRRARPLKEIEEELDKPWEPSERCKDWARREFPKYATRDVLDHFRDHHLSKGTSFLDWDRAFQTWVRRQPQFDRGMT